MPEIPDIGGGQRSGDFWYYFKKSLPIYPGIRNYKAAEFLTEYYDWRRDNLNVIQLVANAVAYPIITTMFSRKARKIANKHNLGESWASNAARLAKQHFIDPNDMALFRTENEAQAKTLLRRFEYAAVNKVMNPKNWQEDCTLGNKVAFHNVCHRYNIPHPQIIATALKGDVKIFEKPTTETIAIKPSGGEGGRGFSLAEIDSAQPYWRDEMIRIIKARTDYRPSGWIIQNKIENHTDLKPIALSAVITARIVTMINEVGAPELITAILRFPYDPEIKVDNLKAGGMMASIDMETGCLDRACEGLGAHDLERHPVSGLEFKGFQVPFIQEAVELSLLAHRTGFSEYSMIGWDVVITDDGPVILEGNGKPAIYITQRGMWENAGEGRFGELLAFHLHKAITTETKQ